jgi:hypothetical protein
MPPADTRPVDRIIVIPKTPNILPALLKARVAIKPVAGDWHITARDRAAFDSLLAFLKVRRIHGILKRTPAEALSQLARTREHNAPTPVAIRPTSRRRKLVVHQIG